MIDYPRGGKMKEKKFDISMLYLIIFAIPLLIIIIYSLVTENFNLQPVVHILIIALAIIIGLRVDKSLKNKGWEFKIFTNTHLAILTSAFILISVIYSLFVNEPIYKLTLLLHNFTMTVSIMTLAIHYNALKKDKEKKKLILFSLVIPIFTIIYFVIGFYIYFILYYNNVTNGCAST